MKNIHILPTDKPSRLSDCVNYKHLYVTSGEEIKKDTKPCWCIDTKDNSVNYYQDALPLYNYIGYKKIILTTDPLLDGVQAIDDEFLEWFVKNPSCESVEVDFLQLHKLTGELGESKYKIIIPQEEPKKHVCEHFKEVGCIKDICTCNTGPKQETLEEAAKRTYQKGLQDDIDLSFYDGVKLGAKWQAERMYSEENMVKFAEWIADSKLHGYSKQLYEAMIIHKVSTTKELLQIWNKQFNEQKNGK
jgi:hypothetical protein